MEIKGNNISLQPLSFADKDTLYTWATASDATQLQYGTAEQVPSREQFFKLFTDNYFTNDHPEQGRCFAIVTGGKPIGAICYHTIGTDRTARLEIWMGDKAYWGQGLATDAIRALSFYLFDHMAVQNIHITHNAADLHGGKACKMAGFRLVDISEDAGGIHWCRMEKDQATARVERML